MRHKLRPVPARLSRGKRCDAAAASVKDSRMADRQSPVLAHQDPGRDDASASGRACATAAAAAASTSSRQRHQRDGVHRRRLQAARRRDLPLHRLRAPPGQGEGLRAAHLAQCAHGFPGCRRPAATGWWPRAATRTGGTRSCPAIRETVHKAGVSVRGRVAASEADVPDEKLEEYIVAWPGKWPKGARRAPSGASEST